MEEKGLNFTYFISPSYGTTFYFPSYLIHQIAGELP